MRKNVDREKEEPGPMAFRASSFRDLRLDYPLIIPPLSAIKAKRNAKLAF